MYSGDELYGDDVTSGIDLAPIRATRQAWPTPTTDEPDLEDLMEQDGEGGCDASDGCWVEPDGTCEHGHPSWMLRLGLI